MKKYSKSEATQNAFIMAAGELFAAYGVNNVGLRDIAKKAKENIGNVHYHFGGKKGFLKAVVDYALEPCRDDVLGKYLIANEELFSTRKGQAKLVAGMISLHYEMVFSMSRPKWCGVLIAQIMEGTIPEPEGMYENGVFTMIDSFLQLYRRISGDIDLRNGLYWMMNAIAPSQMLRQNMGALQKIYGMYKIDGDVNYKKLRNLVICGALANLNLSDETDNVLKVLEP